MSFDAKTNTTKKASIKVSIPLILSGIYAKIGNEFSRIHGDNRKNTNRTAMGNKEFSIDIQVTRSGIVSNIFFMYDINNSNIHQPKALTNTAIAIILGTKVKVIS